MIIERPAPHSRLCATSNRRGTVATSGGQQGIDQAMCLERRAAAAHGVAIGVERIEKFGAYRAGELPHQIKMRTRSCGYENAIYARSACDRQEIVAPGKNETRAKRGSAFGRAGDGVCARRPIARYSSIRDYIRAYAAKAARADAFVHSHVLFRRLTQAAQCAQAADSTTAAPSKAAPFHFSPRNPTGETT